MRRVYEKPAMTVERFISNEYISTCSDTTNRYFKFKCDAGGGKHADIYEGTYPGGTNLTPGDGYFHACGIEHYVNADDANFTDGWYDSNPNKGQEYAFNVIIWKGEANDNVHATKALKENIEIVEGNKS